MTGLRTGYRPTVFGSGLIALDLVIGSDPARTIGSWTGGTCGNVLSILAYLGWTAYPIARMNDDPAAQRVRADMSRWGISLDFSACSPTTHTPIIVQEIRNDNQGVPTHGFATVCPRCGTWLPRFRAVTTESIGSVVPMLSTATVFFMDRLSRAALTMADRAANAGAVIVFEPSSRLDDRMLSEALEIAHIVKYADQRIECVPGAMAPGSATLVEVQTLGARGLRYRSRVAGRARGWRWLPPIMAPRLVDTCGAGDWCTAGLISKIGSEGSTGLRSNLSDLEAALRYGQGLAAWSCGFEGARGGMYAVDRETFEEQVGAILSGGEDLLLVQPDEREVDHYAVACPACPPGEPVASRA